MLYKILILAFPITSKDFLNLSIYNKIIKICESLFTLVLIIYLGIYAFVPNYKKINLCSNSYFQKEHVVFSCDSVKAYEIENLTYYKILSPFAKNDELGVTGLTNKIFLNSTALMNNDQDFNGVLHHELEHVNQRTILGYIDFYSSPKWILEGGAEFFRGKPTLDVCLGIKSWGENNIKQKYFESWVKAYSKLKIEKIPYADYLRIDNDAISFDKDAIFHLFCK
jgi:hypothetical protein